VLGSDLCFRGGLEEARETIVVARAHLEGGAWVPLPASRCTCTSFGLRQVDEVQAETSTRVLRDGTHGPPLCFCPAPKVEDHRAADAEHFVRSPQQAAFKDVSLALSVGFTPPPSEEWNHPLVGCEPDSLVLVRNHSSEGCLADAGQADSQVQCGRFGHLGKPDTITDQLVATGASDAPEFKNPR
jgi:hypothetical protein